MRKQNRAAVIFLLCVLLAGMLAGCGSRDEKKLQTLEDFQHARLGLQTGSSHDLTAKTFFPDAERSYYTTTADLIIAVEQGKVDAYIEDETVMATIRWEGSNVTELEEAVTHVESSFVFTKSEYGDQLREEMNEFLAVHRENGTIDAMKDKWLGDTEPTEHPDYQSLEGERGTIRLAVCPGNKPVQYRSEDRQTGLEMDILTLFAREYGYAFEIEEVPFDSVIAGVASGRYDMAASALAKTPEREETVNFCDPYATFRVVLVVRAEEAPQEEIRPRDYENGVIGVMTGTVYDDISNEFFPEAECRYFSLFTDLITALEQGKIDAYITERHYVAAARWEGAAVSALMEPLTRSDSAFVLSRDEEAAELLAQMNAFIAKAYESVLIDELEAKWYGDSEPDGFLDYDSLTGENGTLRIAVAPDLKPVTYIQNGIVTGFEMELLLNFAQEYGYDLKIDTMTFDAILPGVTTGKYDIGTGAVTITEERSQSVAFTDSHMSIDVVLAVKDEARAAESAGFWNGIRTSFEKTFIRENRWKLIAEGAGVTMLISITAAAAGSLLGFGLYLLSRSGSRFVRRLTRGITKVYSRIVAGTPVVVILMILFYVLFGKVRDISGVLVAVIGFSLTFGAFVYDHMHVSVNSVDPGQTEAAYALGYTKNRTFFRILLPQAMKIFLPSYCGQAVELIKATAVVGYVAVNDLTKMGDIIRSNTYEAFFPLIATAVIYFILTWLLALLLGVVKNRLEPKRRSAEKVLKGVKTK